MEWPHRGPRESVCKACQNRRNRCRDGNVLLLVGRQQPTRAAQAHSHPGGDSCRAEADGANVASWFGVGRPLGELVDRSDQSEAFQNR